MRVGEAQLQLSLSHVDIYQVTVQTKRDVVRKVKLLLFLHSLLTLFN